MAYDFTTIGARIGLAISIILIIRKFHPAYSLIIYEAMVGLTSTVVSVIVYLVAG